MEWPVLTSRRREWTFVSLLVLGVLISRIPAIRFQHELNVDESLMMAQVFRYAHDIVPWRSVDGTTSGPVNTWALLLAHRLGMPLTYPATHFFAALLLAGTLPLLFLAAKRRYGLLPAAVGVTAEATWIALSQKPDFIHYSSELVPIFLISASLALGEKGLRAVGAAFLLGIVPWAKLQAAPIAFVAGLWILYRTVRPAGGHRPEAKAALQVALLAVSGVSFSILILALVAAGGATGEMWNSYFVVTKYYSGSFQSLTLLRRLALFFDNGTVCAWGGILLVLRVCLGPRAVWEGRENSYFPWVLALVSAYVCVRTGLSYEHYTLLMLPALVLLTAASFAEWRGVEESELTRARIAAVALLVFALPRLHEAYFRFRTRVDYPSPETTLHVAGAIHRACPTASSLTLWGWFPSLYVETGLPPSTRHGVYHFLTLATPSQAFLRKTFMDDLVKSGSEVVVDGGPIPLSSFPELETYVRGHFRLSETVNAASGAISVYVRNPDARPSP
jgi:hypothetical protein